MSYRKDYIRKWLQSPNRPRAKCHPDKPNRARGLCASCYGRWLYSNSQKFKENRLAMASKWKKENPEQKKRNDRNSKLKFKYGITSADYEKMLLRQGGVCAICRKKFINNLHVDHNHKTGLVRGLLCLRCNGKLAWLEALLSQEEESWIKTATRYLEDAEKNPKT